MVPEPVRGKTFVLVRGAHCGDATEAARMIDFWRYWRTPLLDSFGTIPFTRAAEISQDPVDPVPGVTSGRWISRLDNALLETILEAITGGETHSPVFMGEIRHAGGAVSTDNPSASFQGRSGDYCIDFVSMVPSPEAGKEAKVRLSRAWQALDGHLAPIPGFLNFTEGAERAALASSTFDSERLKRLSRLKAEFDPDKVFAHGLDLA